MASPWTPPRRFPLDEYRAIRCAARANPASQDAAALLEGLGVDSSERDVPSSEGSGVSETAVSIVYLPVIAARGCEGIAACSK